MKIHISKKGDTLFSIATKYNVDLDKLAATNPMLVRGDDLEPGVKVKVPIPPTPIELPPAQYLHQHTVHQGDTLWKLSKAWNVPLKVLISVNPQLRNPNVLLSGEIVNIPKLADTIAHVSMVAEPVVKRSKVEGRQPIETAQEEVREENQVDWKQETITGQEADTYTGNAYVTSESILPEVNYNYAIEEQQRIMPMNTEWGTNYPVYETNVTNPYETYAIDPRTNIPALPYDDSTQIAPEQGIDTEQLKAQIHQILNAAVDQQSEAAPSANKQKTTKSSEKSKVKAKTSSLSKKSSKTTSRTTTKNGRPWIKM
ncbi:LysM peptidoglycan-binding domain-containing protein [Paenibacillus sp. KN14-4R]|uniref:LysM peptidoglycan-binding domain-containing protein n=1 Tax=Paenibacillus sp. KN14-4R TaxID=3445773 RepID=UPI003FA0E6D3